MPHMSRAPGSYSPLSEDTGGKSWNHPCPVWSTRAKRAGTNVAPLMSPGTLRQVLNGIQRPSATSLSILVASACVAGAGLLRESTVASTLGLGLELDAFVTAFGLLTLVGSALVSTASSALLPDLARRPTRGEAEVARDVAGAAVLSGLLVGVLASAVLYPLGPGLADLLAGGDPTRADLVERLLRLAIPVVVTASAVRGVLVTVLQANGRFPLPAGVQVISSLSIVLAVLLTDRPDVHDLMRWYLVGLTIELVVLAVAVWREAQPRFPRLKRATRLMRPIAPRAAFALGSTLVFGLNPLIDYAIANGLDPGSAARLSVSSRVPLASAALIVAVTVTPSYTVLSRAFGQGGRALVSSELLVRVKRVLVVSSLVSLMVATAGVALAYLFFTHGELSTGDAGRISVTQAVYALAIPPYVAGVLASRALMAADRQATQFVVGAAGALANLGLDLALGELIGINGIALATGLVYLVTFLTMMRLARACDHTGQPTVMMGP